MDGVCYFTGRGRIDGRAVDEKAFAVGGGRGKGKRRAKDGLEDVFDMGRFWEDGYDDSLLDRLG